MSVPKEYKECEECRTRNSLRAARCAACGGRVTLHRHGIVLQNRWRGIAIAASAGALGALIGLMFRRLT